ncbi:hypothetical protein N0V94_005241 [Neodidymelliopsis sp. IMI 364377]|nr:hypothetical protein N0V94_005241 [Neodidymelliopsis sp. IMI 364377]
MSTYRDPTIAELEAQMIECHAQTDSNLANCEKLITKLEARYLKADEDYSKVQTHLDEYKVNIIAPHIAAAAEQLPATALKLKVAEYDLERKTEDYKKLEAKHLETCKSEIRIKKEKKQLEQTVVALTAQLDGKTTPEEKQLQTENERLKEELATLKAQLEHKTDECAIKDQCIADLTDDFAAYQDVTSNTLARRHNSCNELTAALDEQCGMLTAERDYLQSHIDVLTVKGDMLKSELEAIITTDRKELELDNSFQCEGTLSCVSCPSHLERALHILRAAEAQALQLVDQVNHDRMVAWNQLHEYQTKIVQGHYAAVGSWVVAQQAPSVSPTLVSPTSSIGEGWKSTKTYGSSEDGSVKFVL